MLTPETILQQRYRVVRLLGQGGMGAVYEALDERLHRTVALKETLVEGDELRRAFAREARLLANLNHPALPKVIDHFAEDAGQYLVMEHIAGPDLAQQLAARAQPFAAETVARWADELLDALEYLHGHEPPIIHRDIKPANLKLTPKGRAVLLDFGLAKGAAGQMTRLHASQSVLGYTPNYAALEQIQGEHTSPRSDLYALAATLYNLLTKQSPADALKRATEVLNDEADPLRPLAELNPQVPRAFAAVLMRALALRPTQRPETAAALRTALNNALAQTDARRPSPALERETVLMTQPPASAAHAAQTTPQAGETVTVVDRPRAQARRRWPVFALIVAIGFVCGLGALMLLAGRWRQTGQGANNPAPVANNAPTPSAPTPTAPPPGATQTDAAQPTPRASATAEQPKPTANAADARARAEREQQQRADEQRRADEQKAAEQRAAEQRAQTQAAAAADEAALVQAQRALAAAQTAAERARNEAANAQIGVERARSTFAEAQSEFQRVKQMRDAGVIGQPAQRAARQRMELARVALGIAQNRAQTQRQAAQNAQARVDQFNAAVSAAQARAARTRKP